MVYIKSYLYHGKYQANIPLPAFSPIFLECSLQAAGHGLRGAGGAGRGMRVSSRSITQQRVRKTFLCQ